MAEMAGRGGMSAEQLNDLRNLVFGSAASLWLPTVAQVALPITLRAIATASGRSFEEEAALLHNSLVTWREELKEGGMPDSAEFMISKN